MFYRSLRGVALLMALFTLAIIPSCKKPLSEEEKIQALIEDAKKSAEAKDIGGVLDFISGSYKDEYGNDRDALKGLLFYYFQSYSAIGVTLRESEIVVEGDSATASSKVILTGGAGGEGESDILPNSGSGYLLELELVKEEGDWMVVRARWTDIGIIDAL